MFSQNQSIYLVFTFLIAIASLSYGQSEITTERIQITDSASPDFILKSDAVGNATWVNPSSLLTGGVSNWSLNGTHLYNNNSGNVGIGISNPSTTLDVSGNIRATGTFAALGQTPHPDFWSGSGNGLQLSNAYIGTNGSFRSSWFWNGYRNNTAGWTSLGINSHVNTAGIELGKDGIFFLYH